MLLDVFLVQRAEDDHAIQAVDELRPEDALERIRAASCASLRMRPVLPLTSSRWNGKAERGLALDHIRADVGGHDDDRIAEIDFAAAGIGEVAFFHDLQQHVMRFGMGLFDLVKDDDRVRPAAQGFGQLAGFFVADISGRRAHQAADACAVP